MERGEGFLPFSNLPFAAYFGDRLVSGVCLFFFFFLELRILFGKAVGQCVNLRSERSNSFFFVLISFKYTWKLIS